MVTKKTTLPVQIEVRDASVHNLKHIDVDIPLNEIVAISGRSGSGKSSLALGVLYAEGSRRYLDALSTYTRRRISQVAPAEVREVKYLPAAIALRQRPSVPGVRSTVGTMTETLNVIRLMFSRLATHTCPNGHQVPPTIEVAKAEAVNNADMGKITCPTCGVFFAVPSAEDFAFNSAGACPTCGGTGKLRQLDEATLIDHPEKTLAEGAVASWRLPGRNFMPYVIEQMDVRIDVPYQDLTDREKDLVLHGEKKQYKISIPSSTGRVFNMDHALYENAFNAVEDTAKSSTNERTLKRLDRFYTVDTCPVCHGSRFNPKLFSSTINGQNIAEVSALSIEQLAAFAETVVPALPDNMRVMAKRIVAELTESLRSLIQLGLNYLTLERAGETLSTGELQRIQLTKTLHSQTTGVLYVLDEPSVGLHPANVAGLIEILRALVALGNSVVVVEHDPTIIEAANSVIEIGPGAGRAGGQVVAQGSVKEVIANPDSLIGPYLSGQATIRQQALVPAGKLFAHGEIGVHVTHKFNLNDVSVRFPVNRLSVVSGFSGAGKTTLILQSLIPALLAQRKKQKLPAHVDQLVNHHIRRVQMINSVPVGKNVRSTVATYSGVFDTIRNLFADTDAAQQQGFSASRFSYNLKDGACPTCGGTGQINLDIQYLPDMTEECPTCHGRRYNPETLAVKWYGYSIADVLDLNVTEAISVFAATPQIGAVLQTLDEMGLGYLTLGEGTPALSGGEAQRLKLVTQMGQEQKGTLFVFDEPSVGLHPDDIVILLKVFDRLIGQGATIITIDHDLQLIANADYCVDMGPEGGDAGGQILVSGTVSDLMASKKSLTGTYLKASLAQHGGGK